MFVCMSVGVRTYMTEWIVCSSARLLLQLRMSFSQNRQPKHAWHDLWTCSESIFKQNHVPLAVMQRKIRAQYFFWILLWLGNLIKPNIHSNPISVSNQTSCSSVTKSGELMSMSWNLLSCKPCGQAGPGVFLRKVEITRIMAPNPCPN